MTEELELLQVVCTRLEQASISYMLTGSLAANFYATPRMTRDIDIVVAISLSDIDALIEQFHADFYINKNAVAEAVRYESMFNLIHNGTVFKIDFIVRKNTAYRNTEFQRKQRVYLGDVPIWIVSPEDLIISKLFWAKDSLSELQIRDVRNLFLAQPALDRAYIDQWVHTLDLDSIYTKVISHA